MARHDLQFVKHVTPSERSTLHLACRQLAYKTAKVTQRQVTGPAVKQADTLVTESVSSPAAIDGALGAVEPQWASNRLMATRRVIEDLDRKSVV